MPVRKFLYETRYELKQAKKGKEKINIIIPTVGDILRHEDEYYNLVSILTAMPVDLMVQLDEIGVDFTTINDYELFLRLFPAIKSQDTSLIFGDLDLSKFNIAVSEEQNSLVLINPETEVEINRAVQQEIASVLRKIHHLEKNYKKPANKDAQEYMLERARTKIKRKRNRVEDSQLESLIVALVNTKEFKYDFEGAKGLSIYQFNESVRQIIKKVDYDNRMFGVYSGTINAKELSQDDLNWLIHK